MKFLFSTLIFLMIVTLISFFSRRGRSESNEKISNFMTVDELFGNKQPTAVQAMESTVSIPNLNDAPTYGITESLDSETEIMLEELFSQLDGNAPRTEEQDNITYSDLSEIDESSAGVTSFVDIKEDPLINLDLIGLDTVREEREFLAACYGELIANSITTTPALGKSYEQDTMIGIVSFSDDAYYLTYRETSRIRITDEAKLFVGETVIISGTFVQQHLFKISNIKLALANFEEDLVG